VNERILCVIDSGKGIRKALEDVFGDLALIQRCTVHKRKSTGKIRGLAEVSVDQAKLAAYVGRSLDFKHFARAYERQSWPKV
jgi:hypothetical protein